MTDAAPEPGALRVLKVVSICFHLLVVLFVIASLAGLAPFGSGI